MAIFDIFRKPEQPQQAPQQSEASSHVQNNPMIPDSSNSPQQVPTPENPAPESPVAKFDDLWTMEPTQPNQAPNFKLDPQHLSKVSSQMDFSRAVSQEDLSRIAQGGEEAVGALINVLNTVGRSIFSMNAQFTSHMTEQGYNTAQQAIDAGLPNLVKKQFSQNELFQTNPKLKEPALQPLVMAIQSQVAQKHPNATPSEVNAMVNQYFTEIVGKSFAPEQDRQQQTAQNQSFDFSSFI